MPKVKKEEINNEHFKNYVITAILPNGQIYAVERNEDIKSL